MAPDGSVYVGSAGSSDGNGGLYKLPANLASVTWSRKATRRTSGRDRLADGEVTVATSKKRWTFAVETKLVVTPAVVALLKSRAAKRP